MFYRLEHWIIIYSSPLWEPLIRFAIVIVYNALHQMSNDKL